MNRVVILALVFITTTALAQVPQIDRAKIEAQARAAVAAQIPEAEQSGCKLHSISYSFSNEPAPRKKDDFFSDFKIYRLDTNEYWCIRFSCEIEELITPLSTNQVSVTRLSRTLVVYLSADGHLISLQTSKPQHSYTILTGRGAAVLQPNTVMRSGIAIVSPREWMDQTDAYIGAVGRESRAIAGLNPGISTEERIRDDAKKTDEIRLVVANGDWDKVRPAVRKSCAILGRRIPSDIPADIELLAAAELKRIERDSPAIKVLGAAKCTLDTTPAVRLSYRTPVAMPNGERIDLATDMFLFLRDGHYWRIFCSCSSEDHGTYGSVFKKMAESFSVVPTANAGSAE